MSLTYANTAHNSESEAHAFSKHAAEVNSAEKELHAEVPLAESLGRIDAATAKASGELATTDPNSLPVVNATEQILLHSAENAVIEGESHEDVIDKVEAATTFGLLRHEGVLPHSESENVISVMEHDGLHDELLEIEERFASQHVKIGNVDAATEVKKILGEHPAMDAEPSGLEYVRSGEQPPAAPVESLKPVGRVEKALERARGDALEKARAGIEHTEFNGPEVNEAIKGYYVDHEVTLTAMKGLMGASESDIAELAALGGPGLGIENATLTAGLNRLVVLKQRGEEQNFNELSKAMLRLVYREPSVGQLTLDVTEKQRIAQSKANIACELDRRMHKATDLPRMIERELASLDSSEKSTRSEVRNAGQLLFHNSSYGEQIWQQGALRGRAQQGETQESVMMTTVDRVDHSQSTHWSEFYDPQAYKQPTEQQRDSGIEPQAVTYAVPMAEMIKRAPYARGLEYAVVDARPGERVRAADVGGLGSHVVGEIGAGAPDTTGWGGASTDRVFWASADNAAEGAGYDIPVMGDEIVAFNPKTGISESTVYQLQSESDLVTGMHGFKGTVTDQERRYIATQSAKDVMYDRGKRINHPNTGTGYGYPDRRIIEDMNFSTEPGTGMDTSNLSHRDANKAAAEPVIRQIEKESMDRFEGKYIVPLRAKESEFMFKADGAVRRRFSEPIEFLLHKTREKQL